MAGATTWFLGKRYDGALQLPLLCNRRPAAVKRALWSRVSTAAEESDRDETGKEALQQALRQLFWFTYRSGFPGLPGSTLTTCVPQRGGGQLARGLFCSCVIVHIARFCPGMAAIRGGDACFGVPK